MPAEPVRVVIDANVFVSAAIGRGSSTRLIDQWMSGQASFELIVCPRLIGEISDVLDRPACVNESARRTPASSSRRSRLCRTKYLTRRRLLSQLAMPTMTTWLRWRENTTLFGSSPATMTSSTGRSSAHRRSRLPRLSNGFSNCGRSALSHSSRYQLGSSRAAECLSKCSRSTVTFPYIYLGGRAATL